MKKTGWVDSSEYSGATPDEMQNNGFALIGKGRTKIPSEQIVYAWTGKQQFYKRNNNVKYYIGRWHKSSEIPTCESTACEIYLPEETEELLSVLKSA